MLPVCLLSSSSCKSLGVFLPICLSFVIWSLLFSACTPDLTLEAQLADLWTKVTEGDADDALVLQWCQKMEGLARKDPETFADYLIGANAIASSKSQTYEDWERPLRTGLVDLKDYKDFLSEEKALYTWVALLYEDARIHDSKGEVGLAEAKYQEVWKKLPKSHPDTVRLARYRNALPISLAQLYQFTGDYIKAEYWLDLLGEELDLTDGVYPGLVFSTRAQVQQSKGNYPEAIENYETAIEYFLTNNRGVKPGHFMETCISYAEFLRQRGEFDQALKVIKNAAKQELKGERHAVYRAYQLAKIFLSQAKLEEAFQQAKQALILSMEVTKEEYYWHAKILAVQAEIELAQGKWTSAIQTAQLGLDQLNAADISGNIQTSPVVREIESKLDALPLLITKAKGLLAAQKDRDDPALKDLELALQTFMRSIELIRILRAEYEEDEVKEYLSSSSFAIFEPALQTAYILYQKTGKADYIRQGLQIAETSRSLSLLENLQAVQAEEKLNIPRRYLEAESGLKYQISVLERNVQGSTTAKKLEDRRALLTLTRKAYQDLKDSLRIQYPSYYQLKYHELELELSEIFKRLDSETALINFFWGEGQIYAFHFQRGSYQFQAVDRTSELDSMIRVFRKEISTERGANTLSGLRRMLECGSEIYEALIKPLGPLARNLLVVPDGSLHFLPLAALPKNNEADVSRVSEAPFMIKDHKIHRIFSISVWLQQQQVKSTVNLRSKSTKKNSLLVVAPASFPNGSGLSLDSTEVHAAFKGNVDIEREVSRETFLQLLKRGYENILIFSHASAADQRPYILLSRDTLFLEEIYNSSIRANLIVLGACETGLGENRIGEGVLSLARAFIYQNVPQAVMTLWRVQDGPALRISQDLLIHQIESGFDPAEALWQAQVDYLADSTTVGLPYRWAGFVSTGQ